MTVTSPTSDPSERTPPVRNVATIAPTSANGSVRNTSVASRPEPKSASRIRKMAATAPMPSSVRRVDDACRSAYSPSTSA